MLDEVLSPLFTTTWGKKAAQVAVGITGALFLLVFFELFFLWYADATLLKKSSSMALPKVKTSENITQLISAIPKQHLFGNALIASSSTLPVTSLQLRLIGVIKTKPDKYSRVIISEANQPGKVYGIGDVLSSGVTVYGIVDDGVILESSGRLEKLPLPRPPLLFREPLQP